MQHVDDDEDCRTGGQRVGDNVCCRVDEQRVGDDAGCTDIEVESFDFVIAL